MSSRLGSRLGWAGLAAGVVVGLMAGSSGVAAATEDLGGGCIYYAPGEAGGPTKCPNWRTQRRDLSGRDFTGADFTGARFDQADLSGTNFTNANLSGVKARLPGMSPQTQMSGALVDDATYFDGLVPDQVVTAMSGTGAGYFIVGGANPGLPFRFRPPAIPQGVLIDECTTSDAKTVRQTVNGQQVAVKMLPTGTYTLWCTFVTADHPNSKGATMFDVTVRDPDRSTG